mmetsp:Transcript_1351/g.2578  ORF Transcript_1351/g.2578 Transcript_1351/m.2578 type:complete len:345 (-) Transcript_1351:296-1330(-)
MFSLLFVCRLLLLPFYAAFLLVYAAVGVPLTCAVGVCTGACRRRVGRLGCWRGCARHFASSVGAVMFTIELGPLASLHDTLWMPIYNALFKSYEALYVKLEQPSSTPPLSEKTRFVNRLPSYDKKKHVRVVFISDTHQKMRHIRVPMGDVLCVCGDVLLRNGFWYGARGALSEVERVLKSLPHTHKIVIAGNHDKLIEDSGEDLTQVYLRSCIYLENSSVTVKGLKFYGCPYSHPSPSRNSAFQYNRKKAAGLLGRVPRDTDVLLTHSRDELTANAAKMSKPLIHAVGHFHAEYGCVWDNETLCINASSCDGCYRPWNPPVVVDIPVPGSKVASLETKRVDGKI